MPGNAASKSHPLYSVWRMMHRRCEDTTHMAYANYGGRGIRVCKEWGQFWTFVFDMPERPKDTTLDRINNNGNYEPGNCRWATRKQQAANKRKTNLIEFGGERLCKSEWARRAGISPSAFDKRLKRYGMPKALQL